jgi:GntR family phosphonate transport system transcriptional regulator
MDGLGLLWQRIGTTLAEEIRDGLIAPGARLPADIDLAVRFGVNRHTVRRALQHLQGEGLLRSEKGRGTFVVDDVTQYKLGKRTRFTQNLLESHRVPGRYLLQLAELPAPTDVAAALGLDGGRPVLLAVILGTADGVPISLGRNYYPLQRLPGLTKAFRPHLSPQAERLSVSAALRASGVTEYRRQSTLVTARLPSTEEARHLRMPSSEPVLETTSLDVDERHTPLIHAQTAFRASRVQFVLGD